ncbi:MAG TPA: iron-sulfur cluster insertion protein ErpA [Acidimicrobiia bacterium]|nr:iron-sulfur cluster insertion protein ErpA [Acidimicrobiia bacterium]
MIVTDAAASKVAELIAQEDEAGMFLRVAVRPGGCSGLSYEMFFDSEKADDDIVNAQAGIEVAVDPASAPYLAGATLDYKDGLQGAGFAINNPNVSKSCGCGNSFS